MKSMLVYSLLLVTSQGAWGHNTLPEDPVWGSSHQLGPHAFDVLCLSTDLMKNFIYFYQCHLHFFLFSILKVRTTKLLSVCQTPSGRELVFVLLFPEFPPKGKLFFFPTNCKVYVYVIELAHC